MEIRESFFKGINRAISRDEFFDPDFFYTLQNARIFESGRIGEIVRIKGFDRISEELSNLDKLYDFVRACKCVGLSDAFIVYYKGNEAVNIDGEYTYYIKAFNTSGTLLQTLTFTDTLNPEFGELNKYENTTFIAPFNKILYGVDGVLYLRDFIPSTTKIEALERDIEGTKGSQTITFNESLPQIPGRRAIGIITILRNNIPDGVSTDLTISIGNETISPITLNSTIAPQKIAVDIANIINTEAGLSWDAKAIGKEVYVRRDVVGSEYNGIQITKSETGTSYVKSIQRFDNSVTIDADGHWIVTGEPTEREDGIIVSGPMDFVEAASPMLGFTETYGGSDSNQVIGAVSINLGDAIVSNPITLLSTDTTTEIATKIHDTLINDFFVANNYNLSVSTNVLTIESKEVGKRFNHDATISINVRGGSELELPDNFYTVNRTQGIDAHSDGTLELNTNYWYTARIRYIDGYITPTCSPRLINSKANSFIVLDFIIETKDLNNKEPRIQIFRKKEDEPFYLINEISLETETVDASRIYSYVDTGKPKIEPLEEVSTVWTKQHNTQEIFDNRLLKANIKLFDEDYSVVPGSFNIFPSDALEGDKDVAPYNSRCQLYVKPRYSDGTQGFFTELGEILITEDGNGNFTNKKIGVSQTSIIDDTEKDIKELDFYGKYQPFGEEQNLKFNTIEIQTPNLSAIEDPQLFSTQTKIFFGYKYLKVNTTTKEVVTSIGDWTGDEANFVYLGKYTENVVGRGGRGVKLLSDGRLEVVVHGVVRYYVPIADRQDEQSRKEIIYKLQEYEAIKSAISTGELYVRLNNTNRPNLSRKVSDDILLETKVKVVGIEDKTQTDDNFEILVGPPIGLDTRLKLLSVTRDNRLYLILEESDLDEIDKEDVNKREVRRGTSSGRNHKGFSLNIPGSVAFDIINFQERDRATSFNNLDSDEIITIEGRYNLLRTQEVTYGLINRELSVGEEVIYFGTKANDLTSKVFETTGFVFKNQNYIIYSKLAPYNIFRKLITKKDFNFNRTEFTNQIIWSEDLIGNNYFNGGRSIKPFSFFNITKNNGKIIKLISLGKSLYAFCGIGVAKLLVGETLTQQRSGEVYVDSSKFITKSIWILENLNHIKKDSIKKINGSLLFTDGVNVYNITEEGISNISEGALKLNSDDDYIATIVPKYNEYRLSNKSTGETFVYNLNYQQWYGPHTYAPEKSVEINNELISYFNGLIKEEVGNTFNGTPYDTILESVGNDTELGSVDKTYRKFYIDIEGPLNTFLYYGKDYTNMVSINFFNVIQKNGYYNVGISNSEGNTRKVYWNITTTNPDFSLKGFNTGFIIRKRR